MWQSTLVATADRPDRWRWLAAARHPARRDGAVALALFLLPATLALILVLRHHHLNVAAVGVLVSAILGLPVGWLTWAAFRDAKRSSAKAASPSMAHLADQLAVSVRTQWEAEARVRRLNDPYPLPVSWIPADSSLTDTWQSMVKLASSGVGRAIPPTTNSWAAGPDGLAGDGGDLADILGKVPTGRLVVLGKPGAGKTILMVRLVLDLLARRSSGDSVPFLVSLASWNPVEEDLRSWLARQLIIDHPTLGNSPATDIPELTQAAALLATGLITPVLDGLDEIPEGVRGSAISKINDVLGPGEQVVVTCRDQAYRDTVRPAAGIEVTLRGAAGISLCPLDVDAVRNYLCDDAAGPVAKARWDPVLGVLGSEAPAGQALTTPLMVSLARTIYNPRPGELIGTLRNPAELCSPMLADRAAVEFLLFDAFIPATYRDQSSGRRKSAQRWLVFLAYHLDRTIRTPDLAWWEIPRALSILKAPVTTEAEAMERLAAASAANVPTVVVIQSNIIDTIFRETARPRDIESVASPISALARVRRATVATGIIAGIVPGAIGGIVGAVTSGALSGIEDGLALALAFGVVMASLSSTWPWYEIARIWLALKHRLPWSLMRFLTDAHRRGVLRQIGAVYQFRHIELQHRLATHMPE